MKKAAGHISGILKGILFIGFSIQIILGIIWMCFNVTHLQQFEQTEGILYRGLRLLCGGNFWILYLLQLAAAYFAAHKLLNGLSPAAGIQNIWRNLALLTFPMAMQCHLAVSPYSLAGSFLLLELSTAVSVIGNRDRACLKVYAFGGICWLVLALLLPEYFILGAVPLALGFLFRLPALCRQPRLLGFTLLLFLSFGGMIAGVSALAGEKDFLPNKESVTFSLFSRTAWPTLWIDSGEWPEAVREVTEGFVWEMSLYPDNMQNMFRPMMRENFDSAQAAEYYLKMAGSAWKNHASVIVRQVCWDVLGYGATPLILPIQLRGGAYLSYSGRNYEFMFINSPVLTKCCVRYGCWWFGVMLALMAVLIPVKLAEKTLKPQGSGIAAMFLCLLSAGVAVLAYTLRGAGVMDYKCTTAVNLLWLAAALLLMGKPEVTDDTEERAL